MFISKNLKIAKEQVTEEIYSIESAIELSKKISFEKFDATYTVAMNLNLNPKHADQQLRGSLILPNGTGKTLKVLAIVEDSDEAIATKAGADIVGGEQLLTEIFAEGKFDFDIIVTTPSLMPKFAKHGRALGPKGLIPNPKLGTVTNKLAETITNIKKGQIEYRTDKEGNIIVPFGKKSFTNDHLVENFNEIFNKIKSLRPASIKGTYIKNLVITTTMGPGIPVEITK